MKLPHNSIAEINAITLIIHYHSSRFLFTTSVALSLFYAQQFTTGHSSSLADEHCSSCSMAITSASYLQKIAAEEFPTHVAVFVHIDELVCVCWWLPVPFPVIKNAALIIWDMHFVSSNQWRDSQRQSAHRVVPCRARAIKNVVVKQIHLYTIACTKRVECLGVLFYENIEISAWLSSCSSAARTTSMNDSQACKKSATSFYVSTSVWHLTSSNYCSNCSRKFRPQER